MVTRANGAPFQEGDHVRNKHTRETGSIYAIDGGIVYVRMDETGYTRRFFAYVDKDTYIELVTPKSGKAVRQRKGTREECTRSSSVTGRRRNDQDLIS